MPFVCSCQQMHYTLSYTMIVELYQMSRIIALGNLWGSWVEGLLNALRIRLPKLILKNLDMFMFALTTYVSGDSILVLPHKRVRQIQG